MGCFSLYATKNLHLRQGDLITTTDDAAADPLRSRRTRACGFATRMRCRPQQRLTDLQAAIGPSTRPSRRDDQIRSETRCASLKACARRGIRVRWCRRAGTCGTIHVRVDAEPGGKREPAISPARNGDPLLLPAPHARVRLLPGHPRSQTTMSSRSGPRPRSSGFRCTTLSTWTSIGSSAVLREVVDCSISRSLGGGMGGSHARGSGRSATSGSPRSAEWTSIARPPSPPWSGPDPTDVGRSIAAADAGVAAMPVIATPRLGQGDPPPGETLVEKPIAPTVEEAQRLSTWPWHTTVCRWSDTSSDPNPVTVSIWSASSISRSRSRIHASRPIHDPAPEDVVADDDSRCRLGPSDRRRRGHRASIRWRGHPHGSTPTPPCTPAL